MSRLNHGLHSHQNHHQKERGDPDRAACKQAAVQVLGSRGCLSLSILSEGTSDNNGVRCNQPDDLLSLVVELKEEVERLRSIRECERELDWWSNTLAPLK